MPTYVYIYIHLSNGRREKVPTDLADVSSTFDFFSARGTLLFLSVHKSHGNCRCEEEDGSWIYTRSGNAWISDAPGENDIVVQVYRGSDCVWLSSLSLSLFLHFCVSSGCVDPAYGNRGGVLHLLRLVDLPVQRVVRPELFSSFRRVIPRIRAPTRAVRKLSCITVHLRAVYTRGWIVDWKKKLILQTWRSCVAVSL